MKRFFSNRASDSVLPKYFVDSPFCADVFTLALYPRSSTFSIMPLMLILRASNVTDMLFVSKFTPTSFTPVSFDTPFSTRAEQAEQDIPVISNDTFSTISEPLYTINSQINDCQYFS
jgi:hypothetical protein